MPISPQQHAVYRAALSVADSIDLTGRFRAILHLMRCTGVEQIEAVLSLRIDDVGFIRAESSAGEGNVGAAELRLGDRVIALDEEAVAELRAYLYRRARHVRLRLFKRLDRSSLWYVHVTCAGGHAVSSLGTQDWAVARERLGKRRRELARAARHGNAGFLFPATWARHAPVSVGQVRLWINAAVGRGSSRDTRDACGQTRPVHRTRERRRRNRSLHVT